MPPRSRGEFANTTTLAPIGRGRGDQPEQAAGIRVEGDDPPNGSKPSCGRVCSCAVHPRKGLYDKTLRRIAAFVVLRYSAVSSPVPLSTTSEG